MDQKPPLPVGLEVGSDTGREFGRVLAGRVLVGRVLVVAGPPLKPK